MMKNFEGELQEKLKNLKKTETKIKQAVGEDITPEEEERTRVQFFDTGAQFWYEKLSHLTFPTIFIPLTRAIAEAIVEMNKRFREGESESGLGVAIPEGSVVNVLLSEISQALTKEGWKKFFIKLSTRSPKDSPIILKNAMKEFALRSEELKTKNLEEKIIAFASSVQNNFGASSAIEAVNLLTSSERVTEDLEFALKSKENFDNYNIHVALRLWKETIPIHREFRGFIWNRSLNAIGQYYHTFCFPGLKEEAEEIKEIIYKLYITQIEQILPKHLSHFMIDFAVLSDKSVKVIEVNPFDGKHLGAFQGSTGLFLLDNPDDRKIIENGPLEIIIREKPIGDKEIKEKLNPLWRQLLKGFI